MTPAVLSLSLVRTRAVRPRARGGSVAVGLLTSALLLAPCSWAAASAEPDAAAENARLHELFVAAGEALDAGDYPSALRLLREIWEVRQTADVAANLAVAEVETGSPAAAGRHAAYAKRHLLPSATPEQREAIEVLLARARSEAAVLVLRVRPASATVSVNGETIAPEDHAELFVSPGEQRVVVRSGAQVTERRLHLAAGGRQDLALTLADPTTAGARASGDGVAPSRRPSLVPLLVSAGVAAAGGGVAVGFGLAARRSAADAERLSADLGASDSACFGASDPRCERLAELRSRESDQRNATLVGVVIAGAGTAAAAVTSALYVARLHAHPPAASRVTLLPRYDMSTGVVHLGVRLEY